MREVHKKGKYFVGNNQHCGDCDKHYRHSCWNNH